MRRALALALLLGASPAAAQDLYARALTPGIAQARRDAARAQHLEFLAGLPARFLDLFATSPTRAERDALRLEALRLAERALAVTPDDPSLLGATASLRERLGDYDRALRDVDRALTLAPESPDASDLLFTRALLRTPGMDRLVKSPRAFAERIAGRAHYESDALGALLGPTAPRCPPFEGYVEALVDHVRDRLARSPVTHDAVTEADDDPLM